MIKVYVENLLRFGSLGNRLYITNKRPDGSIELMQGPAVLNTKARDSFAEQTDAFLDDSASGVFSAWSVEQFLQAMSDAAWDIGIKPKQLESHSDELKAVRYHLEDMRSLVLKPRIE